MKRSRLESPGELKLVCCQPHFEQLLVLILWLLRVKNKHPEQKKPATSKVFLVGTPKNQMLNPPKNLYFDNLLNSLVTHMHHATWRFYGIPLPEAQWFGLGNPKHQLAETHTSFHSQKADM